MSAEGATARGLSDVSLAAVTAVGLVALTQVGHSLMFPDTHTPAFWPAAGFLIGVLARVSMRRWLVVLISAAAAKIFAETVLFSCPLPTACGYAATNLLEATLAAAILQKFAGSPFELRRFRDVVTMVIGAIVIGPMIGSLPGAISQWWTYPDSDIVRLWRIWWTTDAIGVAVMLPIVVLFSHRPPEKWTSWRIIEGSVLGVALFAIPLAVFCAASPNLLIQMRPVYLLPPLLWGSMRFGQRGAALSALIVITIAAWGTTRDIGWYKFYGFTELERLGGLHAFSLVISLTTMLLSQVVDARRRTELRFLTLVDNAPMVVFEADLAGKCTFVNRHWTALTGRPRDDALGYSWIEAVHVEDQAKVAQEWLMTVGQRKLKFAIECRYCTLEGGQRWALARAIAVQASDGHVSSYQGTILDISDRREAELRTQRSNDELEHRVAERTTEITAANEQLRLEITERSRAEEQLQQQQSLLAHVSRLSTMGQMAAGLAHEVNQPLYAISNYARGLLKRLENPAQVPSEPNAVLERIASEAERAGEIIRRVRSFSQARSPHVVNVSLNTVIRDSVRMTSFEARQRNVDVVLRLAENLPETAVDAIQLQQVVVNLIRNGFEAMEALPPSARSLTIETFLSGDSVGCSVHDAGAGVSPENLPHIFDPFFTTKVDGLGMGLPISRSLVESFAGRLWIEPQEKCRSRFCFLLPSARVDAEA